MRKIRVAEKALKEALYVKKTLHISAFRDICYVTNLVRPQCGKRKKLRSIEIGMKNSTEELRKIKTYWKKKV
jgi:hypothetical protein